MDVSSHSTVPAFSHHVTVFWCVFETQTFPAFGFISVLWRLGVIMYILKTKMYLSMQWQPVTGRQKWSKRSVNYMKYIPDNITFASFIWAEYCRLFCNTNVLMNLTHSVCNFKHIYVQHGCLVRQPKKSRINVMFKLSLRNIAHKSRGTFVNGSSRCCECFLELLGWREKFLLEFLALNNPHYITDSKLFRTLCVFVLLVGYYNQ
jgi:hypothetical protein